MDNVSLTVADINQIKNTIDSNKSKLDQKTQFHFDNTASGDSATGLRLISGDGEAGIQIYAGASTKKLTKINDSVTFSVKGFQSKPKFPVAIASISATHDISQYKLITSTNIKNENGQHTVTVSVDSLAPAGTISTKKPLMVIVNLLLISYA
jgi:hypothetical protein